MITKISEILKLAFDEYSDWVPHLAEKMRTDPAFKEQAYILADRMKKLGRKCTPEMLVNLYKWHFPGQGPSGPRQKASNSRGYTSSSNSRGYTSSSNSRGYTPGAGRSSRGRMALMALPIGIGVAAAGGLANHWYRRRSRENARRQRKNSGLGNQTQVQNA